MVCSIFLFLTGNIFGGQIWSIKSELSVQAEIQLKQKFLFMQLLLATARQLVTCFSLMYLVDEFFCLFLVLLNKMRTLDESRFLVLIRRTREGGELKFFLCYPRGSETSHQTFASEVAYLVRMECLYMIKPMVVGFC